MNSNCIKIVVIGPPKVGKTVLVNTISEYSSTPSSDYRPTTGCRILECEKEFTEDQVKNVKYLKNNIINKIKIQLWDTSGDKKYLRYFICF
jgi:small GTP-binding protein